MTGVSRSLGKKVCEENGKTYEVSLVSDPMEKCSMIETHVILRGGKQKATRIPFSIEIWKGALLTAFARKKSLETVT